MNDNLENKTEPTGKTEESKTAAKKALDLAANATAEVKKKTARSARLVKSRFEEAGGTEAVKKKANGFFRTIGDNFKPDPEAKGLHTVVTRIANLWKSGWTGQTAILVVILLVVLIRIYW